MNLVNLFQSIPTEDLVKVSESHSKLHLDFSVMTVYEKKKSPDKFGLNESQQYC